jgi:hypothetical protein
MYEMLSIYVALKTESRIFFVILDALIGMTVFSITVGNVYYAFYKKKELVMSLRYANYGAVATEVLTQLINLGYILYFARNLDF